MGLLLAVPLALLVQSFIAQHLQPPRTEAAKVSPILTPEQRMSLSTYKRRCSSSADCERLWAACPTCVTGGSTALTVSASPTCIAQRDRSVACWPPCVGPQCVAALRWVSARKGNAVMSCPRIKRMRAVRGCFARGMGGAAVPVAWTNPPVARRASSARTRSPSLRACRHVRHEAVQPGRSVSGLRRTEPRHAQWCMARTVSRHRVRRGVGARTTWCRSVPDKHGSAVCRTAASPVRHHAPRGMSATWAIANGSVRANSWKPAGWASTACRCRRADPQSAAPSGTAWTESELGWPGRTSARRGLDLILSKPDATVHGELAARGL